MPLATRTTPLFAAFALLSVCAPATSNAQPGDPSAFSFLRIEPSARAAALGGSLGAIADGDINTFFFNPALLNPASDGALSLSYLNHVSDISAGFLAYGHEHRIATFAAAVRYLHWGTIQGADESGNRTGTFGASDVALTVGASTAATDQIRYGGALHLIHSNVSRFSSTAVAFDVGVAYVVPDSQFVVAASASNVGIVSRSLGTTSDRLPTDLRLAVSARLQHLPLQVILTAYNLHDLDPAHQNASTVDNVLYHLAIGGEFRFAEAFQVRLGYNHRRHEELRSKPRLDFAGVGLGVGIRIRGFSFDASRSSWSELGGQYQLTVGTRL